MRPALALNKSHVEVLDQTALPTNENYLQARSAQDMYEYIKRLVVRGAPNIGIAGAMGIYLDVRRNPSLKTAKAAHELLVSARPTAVNPASGCDQVLNAVTAIVKSSSGKSTPNLSALIAAAALNAVNNLMETEALASLTMAELGTDWVLREHQGNGPIEFLTICNTGTLVSPMRGTALGIAIQMHDQGHDVHVTALETRPLMQGRLTIWECAKRGIPATLVTDSNAANVLRTVPFDAVLCGADRIAADGSTANKIGSYGLSVLAREHAVPFLVVAPSSTLDASRASGRDITIEQRDPTELGAHGRNFSAEMHFNVQNPAFDVVPSENVTAWITETGVHADIGTAFTNHPLPA